MCGRCDIPSFGSWTHSFSLPNQNPSELCWLGYGGGGKKAWAGGCVTGQVSGVLEETSFVWRIESLGGCDLPGAGSGRGVILTRNATARRRDSLLSANISAPPFVQIKGLHGTCLVSIGPVFEPFKQSFIHALPSERFNGWIYKSSILAGIALADRCA